MRKGTLSEHAPCAADSLAFPREVSFDLNFEVIDCGDGITLSLFTQVDKRCGEDIFPVELGTIFLLDS